MKCPICGDDMLLRRTIEEYYRFRCVEDQGDKTWWSDEEVPDKARVTKYEAVCECNYTIPLDLTSEGFKRREPPKRPEGGALMNQIDESGGLGGFIRNILGL